MWVNLTLFSKEEYDAVIDELRTEKIAYTYSKEPHPEDNLTIYRVGFAYHGKLL